MLNKSHRLFIFEGEKTEGKLVNSLERNFLDNKKLAITCVFAADVYRLYSILQEDDTLDIVNILKEHSSKHNQELEHYNRNSFDEVYLFFDYDPQATAADNAKIEALLSYFDNETEHGKLYISYPMVEALRHYKDFDSFKTLTCDCKTAKGYKALVSNECPKLTNIHGYKKELWSSLIFAHICKMNYIVNDLYEFSSHLETQSMIFENQLKKYVCGEDHRVAVLSAIPIFVLDFYGCERTKKMLCD